MSSASFQIAPDNSATALLCIDKDAAHKAEGLRHLFCLPPLAPSRPGTVKAFRDPTKVTEDDFGEETCHSPALESRMWMADNLLSLMHRAAAGDYPTHFHQKWHNDLHSSGAAFGDEIVPLDNIVRPAEETIFPVIDPDVDNDTEQSSSSSPAASARSRSHVVAAGAHTPGRHPMLLRHAASIPPSAGHVDGDFSLNAHDRAVASNQQQDDRSPQRLRIANEKTEEELEQEQKQQQHSQQRNAEQAARGVLVPTTNDDQQQQSSPSRGGRPFVDSNKLLAAPPAGIRIKSQDDAGDDGDSTDDLLSRRQQQRAVETEQQRNERAKRLLRREAHARKPRPVLYRWKLSVVRATDNEGTVAFISSPLSADAVHRCSIQILANANDSHIQAGTSVLCNGVFDRPGSCFGIVHRSALAAGNNAAAKQDLWNALLWKCDSGATLPGAAMMSAVTSAGRPLAELPNRGRKSEQSEHYIRIGDILTIETRPAPRAPATRGVYSLESGTPPPGVSAHFFINNVEVFEYSNLALFQPYCRARRQTTDSDVHRSEYNMEFFYFGVRLWKGTEIAIVSGDPSRIV